MVLTGTFNQYHALVPSVENGYFSRLLTLIVEDVQPFSERYVQPSENSNEIVTNAAQQPFRLYEKMLFTKPREFRLTSEQRVRLGHHLETAYPTLIRMLGEDFHSVVLRMAVHIERIATILTMLRSASSVTSELNSDTTPLLCSDIDYATAELIGNKLILHMAQAFQLVKGTQKVSTPSVKPLDQKQILLSLLPEKFETKLLFSEALSQGVCVRTATRWNEEWQQLGLVQKLRHGCYKKTA